MMPASATLFRYIARTYLVNFALLLAALLGIVYVFDVVELLRRAAKIEDADIGFQTVLSMGALKLPEIGQTLLPFAVLFSAIYTCWRLNKTHELIVIRAAGLSVWQFLAPMTAAAMGIGILATTLVNPVSSIFLGKYEQMEARVLRNESNLLTISRTGIWLRQPAEGGYALIHADGFDPAEWQLSNVIVFFFDAQDQFTQRIDGPVAHLRQGYWEIRDAKVNDRKGVTRFDTKNLATELTPVKIEDSFSDPETISFWKIPEYIEIMEETGFPATRLHIHFQGLLAQPLLFAAMILLAATFSLRPPRFGGTGLMITLGVLAGFFIFFMESMLQAFGISQKIPVYLAAWTPALVCTLLGMAALLHTEDG